MFILCLALYSTVSIPLYLSFDNESEDEHKYGFLIDIFFFMDIIITFRTTSVNLVTGEEIINPKEIGKRYIKGRFIIDFLSAVPIDKII